MSNPNTPYKHFDLPVVNLPDSRHYIPPPTRDTSEAERRHRLPSGTLLLEQQRDGICVAADVIAAPLEHPDDQLFTYQTTARSLLNSSWYSYAKDAPTVMRRRLELPTLADSETDWRETRAGLLQKIQTQLLRAVVLADSLSTAHVNRRSTERLSVQFGRQVGNAAISLACLPLTNAPKAMSAYDVQYLARLTALDMLNQSREPLGEAYASVAQFADHDSPLAASWRRSAPSSNQAFNAFTDAQEHSSATT